MELTRTQDREPSKPAGKELSASIHYQLRLATPLIHPHCSENYSLLDELFATTQKKEPPVTSIISSARYVFLLPFLRPSTQLLRGSNHSVPERDPGFDSGRILFIRLKEPKRNSCPTHASSLSCSPALGNPGLDRTKQDLATQRLSYSYVGRTKQHT